MQAFLALCAEHLIKQYQDRLERTCVVMPTHRSTQVLKQQLELANSAQIPQIFNIEQFIEQNSIYQKGTPILLLLELFEVFSRVDPNIRLDKFTSWGYILLKDFDQIDRNLVNAEQLFSYLKDIKNIERWKLEPDKATKRIKEYFKLWEHLEETYLQFQERLQTEGEVYAGMLYRDLAENAEARLLKNPEFDQYVFIGFNALSKAEEKIFKTLIDAEKAEIIWDADQYYMDDPENKAGMFLRKYRKNWAGTNWKFQSKHLTEGDKHIQVISVANASMQGKVANQLLKKWRLSLSPDNSEDWVIAPTALVLADEHLLMPVLHSLDESFAGLNVSIGLSLKDSALFNLVDALFEQRQTSSLERQSKVANFSHRSVVKLLTHPFIRQYEKRHCEGQEANYILLLLGYINKQNKIFVSREELMSLHEEAEFNEKLEEAQQLYCQQAAEVFAPLFEALFVRWRNVFELIECLESLLELLSDKENMFEAAYFREFAKILVRLKSYIAHRSPIIDIRSFRIFLYQAFRETSFDFDSDKDTELQVMGITETRNLDFENVVLLSVNETVLPRSRKQNSFIPLDVCRTFDLPTYQEQDGVVSYHFYRLLQRAKQVVLVYVAPSETYGAKEKSRFVLQIEDGLPKHNPKVQVEQKTAKLRQQEGEENLPIVIEKTPELIAQMRESFAEGISPSKINSYIHCRLQYYFSQLADIGQSIRVEETLGADKLGSLIHEILEDIYRNLAQDNPKVNADKIRAVLPKVEQIVNEKLNLDRYVNYVITGQNYIVKQIATHLVSSFLESQIKEAEGNGHPFEILSIENQETNDSERSYSPTISVQFELNIGKDETLTVRIKGITDRIDRVDKQLRIIDYKTGKVEPRQLQVDTADLDKIIHDPLLDKVRQLWLYKYIIAKRLQQSGTYKIGNYTIRAEEHLKAGIYSIRNLDANLIEINTKKKGDTVFPDDNLAFVAKSEEYLQQIFERMLDPEESFSQVEDEKACTYCAYKSICGR